MGFSKGKGTSGSLEADLQKLGVLRERKQWADAIAVAKNFSQTDMMSSAGPVVHNVMGESLLSEGNVDEAEKLLEETFAMDPSNEETRVLLSQVAAKKDRPSVAVDLLEPIDVSHVASRLLTAASEDKSKKGGKGVSSGKGKNTLALPAPPLAPDHSGPLTRHAASLLLGGLVLKAESLDKLGRSEEAADVCKAVCAAVENAFPFGVPAGSVGDGEVRQVAVRAALLLPELYKHADQPHEAIGAYRRALLSPLEPDVESTMKLRKGLAVQLLYGGVEAVPLPSVLADMRPRVGGGGMQQSASMHSRESPMAGFLGGMGPRGGSGSSLASTADLDWSPSGAGETPVRTGATYGALQGMPRGNMEEAAMLLTLMQQQRWDPEVMQHLTFALAVGGGLAQLPHLYRECLPGVYERTERWYTMALAHEAAGEHTTALALLRKVLDERPDDVCALLQASRLCARDASKAQDGARWAHHALEVCASGMARALRGPAYHLLGTSLGTRATDPRRGAPSDGERKKLQASAVTALHAAADLESSDARVRLDLALQYAEARRTAAALHFARDALALACGELPAGWLLLALLLSSQRKWPEAEAACEAGVAVSSKPGDQGHLLRAKGHIQIAAGVPKAGVESYKRLLVTLQSQRRARLRPGEKDIGELEVWQDLGEAYAALGQWSDACVCVDHVCTQAPYSAPAWHSAGLLEQARGKTEGATAAFETAIAMDPSHAPSKLKAAVLLRKAGGSSLALARSYLAEALHANPNDHVGWYNLGLLHKAEGRRNEAADCFYAALLLQSSAPAFPFSSVSRMLS